MRVVLRGFGRMLLLLVLSGVGTIVLMRYAPGYFADAREMDAKYAAEARTERATEERGGLRGLAGMWAHGDMGVSRQYGVPVGELIRPRLAVTGRLLGWAILGGWALAFAAALGLSAVRSGWAAAGSLPFTLLLAVPSGAMATLCLLVNAGGPVLVLALLLAARDFKYLYKLMRVLRRAPHLVQARAQGMRAGRVLWVHLLPAMLPQMVAIATLSLVTSLSAMVPVEVIFDVPGVGQLAWAAASNRDLPVLLAITLLMAGAVGLASVLSDARVQERPA